jgi:hypothetical protein
MVQDKIIYLNIPALEKICSFRSCSTVFASKGACNVLAVRDNKTSILNKENVIAILPVLTPTILTA